MKKILILAALLITVVTGNDVPAATVNIEYILDGSGSMLELMGDKQKIEVAKQTLTDLIDKLPAEGGETELNVGLRVYGHASITAQYPEEPCRATALEVPVSGVNVAELQSKIAAISARGWTPIAYSLERAAEDFPVGDEYDNIIILISDGKETCGGAPCEVAGNLHKAGIKVKIHVVGFDIKDAEKAGLECIARAGGGEYFSADSADELTEALEDVQEQVLKEETTSVRIKIGGPGTLEFKPAEWVPGTPYLYKIVSEDGTEVASGEKNLDSIMLPSGTYRLSWYQWRFESRPVELGEFTITSGQTTVFPINTGINLVPGTWLEKPPYYWYLQDKETGKKAVEVWKTFEPVPTAPGTYELYYHQWRFDSNPFKMADDVVISAGEVTEIELDTGVGLVPSSDDAEPPYRWVLSDPESGEELITVNNNWGPIPVPPGDYGFSLQQTRFNHSLVKFVESFPVKKGQLVELEF